MQPVAVRAWKRPVDCSCHCTVVPVGDQVIVDPCRRNEAYNELPGLQKLPTFCGFMKACTRLFACRCEFCECTLLCLRSVWHRAVHATWPQWPV